MKSTVRHFITVIVLVTLVLGALAIAPASFARQAAPLYTSAGVFVPGRSTLNLPTELTIKNYQVGKRGYYIVQFAGPIEQA